MRTLLLLCCVLVIGPNCWSKDIKYPVSAIPKELLKNANTVKRMEEVTLEIVSPGETIEHHKYAITVLNEAGDNYAIWDEPYDKLTSIHSVEGRLFDADGIKISELKQKDIKDESAVSDISLYDDNRVKWHGFFYKSYPYTVEYEYEIRSSNTLFFPKWIPIEWQNLSVENSKLTVIAPQSYKIRYRVFNYKEQPQLSTIKDKQVMTWEVKDLQAIKRPYASPKWNELTTAVYLAPSEFEVQGYKGNMDNWEDFGKFSIALNKDRDKLPDEVIAKVQQLISGITDDREKVKILYKYLQNNTRYISIQLGIGGWQPFEADFVNKKGYGDCKALSNYMNSLLKAAGIKSYYTLVHAGEKVDDHFMIEDFPSNQYNHAIVCVPFTKDTMWLECTDQYVPAGYMGGFTGNRKALLITEDGGKLVSTPRYGLKENLLIRSVEGLLDVDGNLNIKTNTDYRGTQQDEIYYLINALSKEKIKKMLNRELDLSSYDINDFKYETKNDKMPEVNEHLDITVSNYATVSGKRLFIVPNVLSRSSGKLDVDSERTADLVFSDEYRDEDNVEIEVPVGYQLESGLQDATIKTKFGTYTATAKLTGNKIAYHRVREEYSGRFPAKDQVELAKYYADIYKADRNKLVLVKSSATPAP